MRTLPRWTCTESACGQANSFTSSRCDSCGTESGTLALQPCAPNDWKIKEVAAVIKAFRNSIDKIQISPRGVEGTLTLQGVLAALNSVPVDDRKKSMFLDIGCGRGHVLVAAMVFGFPKVAGLEQSDFREQWSLRIHNARELRFISQYQELWTQSDPEILWNTQVQDLAGLKHDIQRYRWHGLVTIYLFWTGWTARDKLVVLEYIRNNAQVKNVCIVDECRRPQGHRRTFDFMIRAGFVMKGHRSGLSISCSSGSEKFALICWRR